MKNIINIVSILLILGFLSVCSKEQSETVAPKPIKVEENQKLLVSADNKLGLGIYKSILKTTSQNSNILISPISLNKSLCIPLYGMENSYGIKRILQLTDLKKEAILTEINKLNSTILNIDQQSEFKTSTSFITDDRDNLNEQFKKLIHDNNDLQIADFNQNKKELPIKNICRASIFSINNEINLTCNLKYQTGIEESPFYLNPNQSKFVEMLICESKFNYYSDNNIKAIEMPIGRGNFNAMIILPQVNQSLKSIKNKLNIYYINKINEKFKQLNLSVYLPKLNIDYTGSLNNSLKKQGLQNLFMTKGEKYKHINSVKKLCLYEFSQSVNLKMVSKPVTKKILFDTKDQHKNSLFIDRPFLFIITEKYSGSIIFIGQIINPVNEN
ncbi:MAG: serpin family protein [Bacteroidota bacterium]